MKRIAFFVLFVTIVSNNVFGQDTLITYKTNSIQFDEKNDIYKRSDFYDDINFFIFTNKSIIIKNLMDSTLNEEFNIIQDYGELNTQNSKPKVLFCEDKNKIGCFIYVKNKDIGVNKFDITIKYKNTGTIYYILEK